MKYQRWYSHGGQAVNGFGRNEHDTIQALTPVLGKTTHFAWKMAINSTEQVTHGNHCGPSDLGELD